ncbi:MAG: hypothetical protein GX442_26170 [Candidatus Riflebacteria bacterium]|nr:hypothetical protein [Candidatus Riflebacteria bacterium]
MRSHAKREFRPLAVFLAFLCSLLLTGCGGGGGGGGGFISPVGPGTGTTGTVEGYVSTASLNNKVRANLAATLETPAENAAVQLIALDPTTGVEIPLGAGRTDDKGYYQIPFTSSLAILRNLIVRATANGRSFEALLPMVVNGRMVRAPTMDPESGLPVKIVREAAKFGKHLEINLGEVLSVLPEEALQELEGKIAELVRNLVAREQAMEARFGTKLPALRQFAFDLQQRINEAIEKGEMTPAEGWKLFDRELAAKAAELGFSATDRQAMDDMDQTFVYEPFLPEIKRTAEWQTTATERLKERKLRFLEVVTESVRTLVPDTKEASYQEFFALVEKIAAALEAARTPAEIQRFFTDNGQVFLTFGKYLSLALMEVNFTPDLVGKVFAIEVPAYGFDDSLTGADAVGSGVEISANSEYKTLMAPQGDPAGRAIGFVRLQDQFIERLITRVQEVAAGINPPLTAGQAKAVAYLIWAQTGENLNFPTPPVVTGPDPAAPYSINLSGRVQALATPMTLEGESWSFTHSLESVGLARVMSAGSSPAWGGAEPAIYPAFNPTIAWLAQEPGQKITLTKVSETGAKTETQVDLADLAQYAFVEVEGLMVKSPYTPVAPTDPDFPTDPGQVIPMSVTLDSSGGGSGSGPGSSGEPGVVDGYPGTGVISSYDIGPMYLVVTRARVLPPPPAEFSGVPGKVVQATAGGKPVAGLFVFSCADPAYDGAVLQAMFVSVDTVSSISLAQWVGKGVTLAGVLYTEGERKTIQVTDIH